MKLSKKGLALSMFSQGCYLIVLWWIIYYPFASLCHFPLEWIGSNFVGQSHGPCEANTESGFAPGKSQKKRACNKTWYGNSLHAAICNPLVLPPKCSIPPKPLPLNPRPFNPFQCKCRSQPSFKLSIFDQNLPSASRSLNGLPLKA